MRPVSSLPKYNVTSEIGRLRTVIMHRPGIEIARLTPENKDALLFDDILWVERAQQEHDQFVDILRSRGVEVLYLHELLAETLQDEAVRASVVDQVVAPAVTGPRVSDHLRRLLRECDMDALLDVLIGGILQRELPDWGVDPLFAGLVADRYRQVIRALPNLVFMRDNAAWIGNGLS
ncbi:MAG: arginine deiminase family protein, partial [Acidimicrobiia bacterium]